MSEAFAAVPASKSRRANEPAPHISRRKHQTLNNDVSLILPPRAHWSDRGLAAIIDFLLFLTPAAIGILLAAGISPISTYAARMVVAVAVVTSFIVLLLSWMQEGGTGQTTGKRILGLVCVGETNGRPIGYLEGIRKGVLRVFVDMLPLGYGWFRQASRDGGRKTNSDTITKSTIVYSRTNEQQENLKPVKNVEAEAVEQGKILPTYDNGPGSSDENMYDDGPFGDAEIINNREGR